ncbi:MAG: hypothetical protein JSS46_15770 [Proteobacteria bacterium]|jgi:cytochrome c peroxidase|nr:hypothetical protein [Pseudomonadota bacterium]
MSRSSGRLPIAALLALAAVLATPAYGGGVPFAPLPPAAAVSPDLADLGRHLYFDTRLSSDWGRSCARCHDPQRGWGDDAALSKGYTNSDYFRNAPSLLNVAQRARLMWDGGGDGRNLAGTVHDMIVRPDMMHADPLLVAERLKLVPEYAALWRKVYGADAEITPRGIDAALAAFLETVRSRNIPFERFLAGDETALSPAARQGLQLFTGKAGCVRCHQGALLSDQRFHRLAVPENPTILADPLRAISMLRRFKLAKVPDVMTVRSDLGRYAVTGDPEDRGRFLTPSLLDLKWTAPYMHNGVFASLAQVVDFYDRGGGPGSELEPLHLAASEKKSLLAFLGSLSGDRVVVDEPIQWEMRARAFDPRAVAPELAGGAAADGEISAARNPPPLQPLPPVPVPADDRMTASRVELGRMLFWDPRISGNGSTPCVSCHFPQLGWGDGNAISRGYPGTQNYRNALTVLNAAYFRHPFWEGSADGLEAQAETAGTGPVEGNADPAMMEMRLRFVPEYVKRFREAFGTPWPRAADVWRAIASFERTIVSNPRDVPFDRYMNGDESALSPAALRGYRLFAGKAGCVSCHNGPLASDERYHSVGLPENPILDSSVLYQATHSFAQRAKGVTDPELLDADVDLGRYYQTGNPSDIGKFRTPGLRELKYTAPYMHNGRFATLGEVVDFFDRGGGMGPNRSPLLHPLHLGEQEKHDLVAFLESLSMDHPLVVAAPQLPPLVPLDHREAASFHTAGPAAPAAAAATPVRQAALAGPRPQSMPAIVTMPVRRSSSERRRASSRRRSARRCPRRR